MADDDEISIDLGKIKDLFKGKKKGEQSSSESHKPVEDKPSETKTEHHNPHTHNKPTQQEHAHETHVKEHTEHHISPHHESKPVHHQPTTPKKEDDDEINIDFSKVTKLFKGSGEKTQPTSSGEKEDDEINIDFSKVKNIFKGSGEKTEKKDDDEIVIDFKSVGSFFIRHASILLLIVAILLSVYLRTIPAELPITDRWAEDTVINSLRSQVANQINAQYPNLPQLNRDTLIQDQLNQALAEQGPQIDQQIAQLSAGFKQRLQDDDGTTYLLAIDPHFWMRHAKNILENGHPGDELRNGIPWDNHMYAPDGRGVPNDMFHAWFIAFFFKFLSIFNNGISLMRATFFVPVIISALAVIPTFFITRKIAGNMGGFVAAAMIAIHPAFLTRTVGGFSDTDAYNVMFPLFIAWLFYEALDANNIRMSAMFSVGAGLLVGLYAFTWGGWWYIFDFILISTFVYVGYYSFVHKRELLQSKRGFLGQKAIKNSMVFLLIFFIVSGIAVSFLISFSQFEVFATNPLGFARLKEVGITTIWPNVFTTVAEQNPASLNNVINQTGLGRPYMLFLSLMGIVMTLLMTRNKFNLMFAGGTAIYYIIVFFMKVQDLNTFLILISIPIALRIGWGLWTSDKTIDLKYALLLILWFIATIYASTKGIRFTLLIVPAFAIGIGIMAGFLFREVNRFITRAFHINKWISYVALFAVIVIVLIIPPFTSAKNTALNEVPSFNDAWRQAMVNIQADSEPDAIINSWWDFGHWFKMWSDRAVTFDGTSQNTPQAHWIGNVLRTSDEKTAIGILRMLDCSGGQIPGGTKAFAIADKNSQDGAEAINVMYEVIKEDKDAAQEILEEKGWSGQDVDEFLSHSHCEPPANYFITSEDMIGKSGVWGHFGAWDFERGLMYNTIQRPEYRSDMQKSSEFLQERFGFEQEAAENLFFEIQGITTSDQANSWIAPWPAYAGVVGCRNANEELLVCDNGLQVNLTTYQGFFQVAEGVQYPSQLAIPLDDELLVRYYNESLLNLQNGRPFGVALIKSGFTYSAAVQMDADLTAAMFTRMFYQDGVGLEHFKKFDTQQTVFGGQIFTWKVDWEGQGPTNITPIREAPQPPDTMQEHNAMDDPESMESQDEEPAEAVDDTNETVEANESENNS